MTHGQAQVLIGLGTAVAVLLVVLVAVVLLGGGEDAAAPTTAATTTSAEASSTTVETTTTAVTTSSTTTSSTTTTAAPGACAGPGAGPMPAGATVAVEVPGDFDGEDGIDRFLVYRDSGGTYWARVELSYGYAAVAPDPQPGPGVIDAKAVNLGGGADLAIAESMASPAERLATFYAMYGCTLAAAARDTTEIAQFPLRGAGLDLAGITCGEDGFNVTRARNLGGSNWEASSVFFLWVPGIGEFQGQLGAAAILTSPDDNDIIQSHADWDC